MSTLYWLTVLGKIELIALVFFVVSLIVLIASLLLWADAKVDEDGDELRFKKIMKYSFWISASCLFCSTFIPSKTELYLIYGVGNTMDYLKENPTAKQLPDKFVKAIDKWADSFVEEQEKKKEDK